MGSVIADGTFFLDFSRPLKRIRWFVVRNEWFGVTVGLLVPIVHERERTGGYVIGVSLSDPYFTDLQALWKANFPSQRKHPGKKADNLRIVADFAAQFPEDSR